MNLNDYTQKEIEAALKIKGLNHVSLAKKLNRSTSAISKVIKGTLVIQSESLNNDILEALRPEIEIIHKAFKGTSMLKDSMISTDLKLQIAGNHG